MREEVLRDILHCIKSAQEIKNFSDQCDHEDTIRAGMRHNELAQTQNPCGEIPLPDVGVCAIHPPPEEKGSVLHDMLMILVGFCLMWGSLFFIFKIFS